MSRDTSWENVKSWYDAIVGKEGHYYHQHVVIPHTLKLLSLDETKEARLLDLGCGQGILSQHIPSSTHYLGVDLSSSLIESAKQHQKKKNRNFLEGDICKPLPTSQKDFTHATVILALQNVESPQKVIEQASLHLQERGILILVLNHPCFRIPRQSHWGIDEQKKLQYRRMDLYLSSLKIPIQMHPGKGTTSESTWSFHHPLSSYFQWLHESNFATITIEEWISDKKSTGPKAKLEDRARKEFPLFLAIKAQKWV